jgi:pimeloyl-ACP methyl ester carboxylesterase
MPPVELKSLVQEIVDRITVAADQIEIQLSGQRSPRRCRWGKGANGPISIPSSCQSKRRCGAPARASASSSGMAPRLKSTPAGRLGWSSLMSKIFSPATISRSFSEAIKEMALRPSQLHSSAAESTLMIPNAIEMQSRYGELMMPVSIVVGADDRLIKAKSQSMRLHENIPGSALHVIPGIGHMVHCAVRAEGGVIRSIF